MDDGDDGAGFDLGRVRRPDRDKRVGDVDRFLHDRRVEAERMARAVERRRVRSGVVRWFIRVRRRGLARSHRGRFPHASPRHA